jgi:hypothetical protein
MHRPIVAASVAGLVVVDSLSMPAVILCSICGPECKRVDVRERQRQRRRRFADQKCPYCGRKSSGDHKFARGVSRHAPPTCECT